MFRKLNFQLFFVASCTILVLVVALGIVLPYNIRNYFDDFTFEQLLAEQQRYLINPETYVSSTSDITQLRFTKSGELMQEIPDLSSELLHDITTSVKDQRTAIERYVYHHEYEHIYYIINQSKLTEDIVTIKYDHMNNVMAKSVFYQTASVLALILSLLLIGILWWSYRLISNLKEIKRVVKRIGNGDLDQVIISHSNTREMTDLMNELDIMRQSLKQNEMLKQEMIHNISHDLKTPIAIIKMSSESIVDGIYPYGSPEASAKVIFNQAERLERKVKKLLYLNHLDYLLDQEISENFEVVELGELIRRISHDLIEFQQGITIQLQLEKTTVIGNEEKWRVIIENLLDNATRYAISLISIKLQNNVLEIYNDGPPIKEVEMGSIFKAFEVGTGGQTGLGLAIVSKTLQLYEYSISYENKEEGVTFIIKEQDE